MKAQRFEEYIRNGCHFSGKLVVVQYYEDMEQDPKWGTFNAELTFDYLKKARELIKERQYDVVRELLAIPDLVCELR